MRLSGNDYTNEILEGSWSRHTNVFALVSLTNLIIMFAIISRECMIARDVNRLRCLLGVQSPWNHLRLWMLRLLVWLALLHVKKEGSNDYVSHVTDIRI